jgi:protein-L-isoaspartate O-methyltransferase
MKARLVRQLWRYRAYRSLIKDDQSYLHTTGWMETLRRGYPCRPDGAELPWMNYPMIAFLEQRITGDLLVFEYGSGYSTIFFARLAKSVHSVEHDQAWHETIRTRLPPNAHVTLIPLDRDGRYCRSIQETEGTYDLVVVDGRDRVNCIIQCLERLSPRGVILLDDSQRDEYAQGLAFARDKGFSALDFVGLKPGGQVSERTTLLYRPGNCLRI